MERKWERICHTKFKSGKWIWQRFTLAERTYEEH
jgi:hypothetical protein